MSSNIRVGVGFDVHPLVPGRRLILGGVQIPFDRGLSGWSDGDVLLHAIMDALLGAAALGDIGQHFPSGKPQYKDIHSLRLLKKVGNELRDHGWGIINIDATIVVESPRLSDFFEPMRRNIDRTLRLESDRVNVKATASEGLGYVGRGEGICVYAVALIERLPEKPEPVE